MKAQFFFSALLALAASVNTVHAQTVLAVDFNMRGANETDTQSGFNSFAINSVGSATLTQTGTVSRVFGSYTVSLAGSGSNPGYVDRHRTTPTDSGALTQSALYRDFVFSSDTGSGGLNVTVDGLLANQTYQVTIWSFDSGSTGGGIRYSDWTANGILERSGYNFTGTALPTSNTQNQITFKVTSSPGGQIAIQGRRVAPTAASQVAVFLNALQLDLSTPDAPTIATARGNAEVFAGDNAIFTVTSDGTAPFTYHWFHDSALVGMTTTATLVVSNAQTSSAGNYSVIVSNITATTTSSVTPLAVTAVQNVTSGLLAYWPLDSVTLSSEDLSIYDNAMVATNIDSSNLVPGRRGNALTFNGADEHLIVSGMSGASLPASIYPAYSVAFWVKGDGTNQLDKRVFAESSSTNNNSLLTLGTGNPVGTNALDVFIRFNNGGNPINHRKTSLPVFDDTWHHVVWVDNNGFGTVYVDGVADTNSFNYTRGVLTPNIENIGGIFRDLATPSATAFFAGIIDDVAIWRRSLASNEIAYVIANGPVLQRPNFTEVAVSNSVVTLRISSPNPLSAHLVQQTLDVGANPITWTEVTNATFSVNGSIVTAQFPQPASAQAFYRVSE